MQQITIRRIFSCEPCSYRQEISRDSMVDILLLIEGEHKTNKVNNSRKL